MIRALSCIRQSEPLPEAADVIVLDHIDRRRRRIQLEAVHGLSFLLDLPSVPDLRMGDMLVLEDGRYIEVVAAAERLCEIKAHSPLHLTQIAWHLGNRHIATEVRPTALRIKSDHVIEDMLRGLGAHLRLIEAPFQPESGAYTPMEGSSHQSGHHHG